MFMTLDLVGAVGMTLSAAVVVVALSIAFGDTPAGRIRLAAAFGLWFVAVVALAASEVFHYTHPIGVQGLGVAVVLPVIVLAVVALRDQSFRHRLETTPLSLFIGINVIRVLGVLFVLLYLDGRLPAPFAPLAGWGDIITGVAAVPVAWLAQRYGRGARVPILIWNVFGIADLIDAIGLGVISSPGPLHLISAEPGSAIMATLPWMLIPAFLVPLLFATHLAVFYQLRRLGDPQLIAKQ
jgi:hypothetical protein